VIAKSLHQMGFKLKATRGTCLELIRNNIPTEFVLKVPEGRPNIVDHIINGEIDLIINTAVGKQSISDSFSIRRTALDRGVPYVTTMRGAAAVVDAIRAMKHSRIEVAPIQEYNLKVKSESEN
jgi:carbamoyl-phosphate synthase large subunit